MIRRQGTLGYNIAITFILVADNSVRQFRPRPLPKHAAKQRPNHYVKRRQETPAKKIVGNDRIELISSAQLQKGDVILCETGDIIPSDGEIIEGLATIDESAITGESAPVIRESGG